MSRMVKCIDGEYRLDCDYGIPDGGKIDVCPMCDMWYNCWKTMLEKLSILEEKDERKEEFVEFINAL